MSLFILIVIPLFFKDLSQLKWACHMQYLVLGPNLVFLKKRVLHRLQAMEASMYKIDKDGKLVMLIFFGLLWFIVPEHSACGLVLTFDDLAGSMQQDLDMPATYHGFSWQNVNVLQSALSVSPCDCSDFGAIAIHSDVSVLNDAGEAMVISRNESFTWFGATFSAADFESGQITIEGYIDGILSFSSTILLDEFCPYDLKVKWNVDELVIYASGDNLLGRFTLDDFRYGLGCEGLFCPCRGIVKGEHGGSGSHSDNPPSFPPKPNPPPPEPPPAPVPEPATVFLFGAGVVMVALRKFGRKRA